MPGPKCFISYSWDSSSHKDWVRLLAEQLHQNGVYTSLDQWDVSLGVQLPEFMEKSIRETNFVLLVCTSNFATKADAGQGGVGYEKNIVTGEMFSDSVPDTKFVALLREGEPKSSLPSYLKSKAYLDFRKDDFFDENFEELLRHIYRKPKYVRPPLGTKPKLEAVQKGTILSSFTKMDAASQNNLSQKRFPINIRPNYDQIESVIKSYGVQLIRFQDRKVVVELKGRTITYQRPKRANRPVSEGLIKELEEFFKGEK